MTRKEISEFLEIGRTTVDRIVNADFDAEKMLRMRKEKEKNAAEAKKSNAVNEIYSQTMLITGKKDKAQAQITMDLEEKHDDSPDTLAYQAMNYQKAMDMMKEEAGLDERDKKLMRFEAGQVEKVCALLIRIDDRLAQVLRRMDGCGEQNGQQ